MHRASLTCAGIGLYLFAAVHPAWAADAVSVAAAETAQPADRLLAISLEELLASEVTSVAKKPQRAADSPAAVYVIGQEDIQRSSARTLADLLRMVPGIDVGSVTSLITSVSARGLDSTYNVGVLVMIDGAAIYSSSIAGMFWDQALVPLQDIERIEVIRGPGGTLWGGNSVDGIINIITKQAIDTQGLRAMAKVGATTQRVDLGYGRQLRDNVAVRVYGYYAYDRGLDAPTASGGGHPWADSHRAGMVGARVDVAPRAGDALVGLIEASTSSYDEARYALAVSPQGYSQAVVAEPNSFDTFHTLLRWRHRASDRLDLTVQGYFNHFGRSLWGSRIARNLGDLSLEGRWQASGTHEFNFGLGGRISHDRLSEGPMFTLPGGDSTDRWVTGYVQDEIALSGQALRLTVGSKFEVSSFSGFIAQPSARLFWRPAARLGVWAAVTRAVRTPQLRERSLEMRFPGLTQLPGVPGPVPVQVDYSGSNSALPERLISYEAGARLGLGGRWLLDLTGFYNDYSRLNTANLLSSGPLLGPNGQPFGLLLRATIGSQASGHAWGGEVMLKGHPLDVWTTELSWSYINLAIASWGPGFYPMQSDGAASRGQLRWRNMIDLSDRVGVSSLLHHVSRSQDGM
ncbi:MAG TPA: TonB-dependent receptor, partial [Novosphingobium sp.]|nr:TonB-dependent receptor [Novosphingobium sp.]